jgi:hypothetical protein
MNAVSTLIRRFAALRSHCEAKLEVSSLLSQSITAASPKQSHRTDFAVESFPSCWKISVWLSSARRLLRRWSPATYSLNFVSFFRTTPRNDEGERSATFFAWYVTYVFNKGGLSGVEWHPLAKVQCQQVQVNRKFGGVKNLLEGSL